MNTDYKDAISRQAAIRINELHHGQMPNHINHEIWEELKGLPSVTPKQRTGHWISSTGEPVEIKYGSPVRSCWCSECGEWLVGSDEYECKGKFCPNCGAKMGSKEEQA